MRELWYGDNRDLVKWGTLVQLAREERINKLVQVAFLRETERPRLRSNGEEFPIAWEVWKHFRDLRNIEALGQRTGIEIEVIDRPFDERKRREYLEFVKGLVQRNGTERKIVLLDPDTGIEPRNVRPEHVTVEEIKAIWGVLSEGDWLVLYQHRWRAQGWIDKARGKFAKACGAGKVRTYLGMTIAPDVALFAAKKA
ncbi:MAG: hypothetical protein GXP39_05395 [Chloroflexi bacterium]|nr:hypothetical protein [Chloroflexota bacterium]